MRGAVAAGLEVNHLAWCEVQLLTILCEGYEPAHLFTRAYLPVLQCLLDSSISYVPCRSQPKYIDNSLLAALYSIFH